jgi:hypothetical protein
MGAAARERVEAFFGVKKQAMDHIALYRREWIEVARTATPTLANKETVL